MTRENLSYLLGKTPSSYVLMPWYVFARREKNQNLNVDFHVFGDAR